MEKYNVKLIGVNTKSISLAENRSLFGEVIKKLGYKSAPHIVISEYKESLDFVAKFGLPLIIRSSFTLGGSGGGIAYTKEEFKLLVNQGLEISPINRVQIDKSLLGWKEYELEAIRDADGNTIIVCGIENIDPMGIHTGDSITVTPIMTLRDKEYQALRDASVKILDAIGIVAGGANVQFSVNPEDCTEFYVIEMNPRVSRSSALASKATGYPIAKVSTKLALGYRLHELQNDCTPTIPASFEPALDYVVIKVPRFDFKKFINIDNAILNTAMQSVGESMAIGRNFTEAMQKAINSLEIDNTNGFYYKKYNKNIEAMPSNNCFMHDAIFFLSEQLTENDDLIDNDIKTNKFNLIYQRFLIELCKIFDISYATYTKYVKNPYNKEYFDKLDDKSMHKIICLYNLSIDVINNPINANNLNYSVEIIDSDIKLKKLGIVELEMINKINQLRTQYIQDNNLKGAYEYWFNQDIKYVKKNIENIPIFSHDMIFHVFYALCTIHIFEIRHIDNPDDVKYLIDELYKKCRYDKWFINQIYKIASEGIIFQKKVYKRTTLLIDCLIHTIKYAQKDTLNSNDETAFENMYKKIVNNNGNIINNIIDVLINFVEHKYTDSELTPKHNWLEILLNGFSSTQIEDINTEERLQRFTSYMLKQKKSHEKNNETEIRYESDELKQFLYAAFKRKNITTKKLTAIIVSKFGKTTSYLYFIQMMFDLFFDTSDLWSMKQCGFSYDTILKLINNSIIKVLLPLKHESVYKRYHYYNECTLPHPGVYDNNIFSNKIIIEAYPFIRKLFLNKGVKISYKRIDTCAAEFDTQTKYLYSTFEHFISSDKDQNHCESNVSSKDKVIIIGSGPNRIGQGIEFDYMCVNACKSFKEKLKLETIMINCNPETVSTDYNIADKLYFEPLSISNIMDILCKESSNGNILGVVVQLGGQTPLRLVSHIENLGIKILGTTSQALEIAEDRNLFRNLCHKIGVHQPRNIVINNKKDILNTEKGININFPVIARPSDVLGGSNMNKILNLQELLQYTKKDNIHYPILIEEFIEDAIEIDVDAIASCKDNKYFIKIIGVLQHIEEAGIHSGDSSSVLSSKFAKENYDTVQKIEKYMTEIAKSLNIKGFMNAQFLIKDDKIFIIEVNPRGSRTIPFIAKCLGSNICYAACCAMLGDIETLQKIQINNYKEMDFCAVKSSVFPFAKFKNADTLLGPEMKSTGEVMGLDRSENIAFAKAQVSANNFPNKKLNKVIISVKNADKNLKLIDIIKITYSINSNILIIATPGTMEYIKNNTSIKDLNIKLVNKIEEDKNNVLNEIMSSKIDFILNTSEGKKSKTDDRNIRKIAILKKISYTTNMNAALKILEAIKEIDNDINKLVNINSIN